MQGTLYTLTLIPPFIRSNSDHSQSGDVFFSVNEQYFKQILTISRALMVVSSMEAAVQPSSVEPPSHIPIKAAMLL